MEAATMIKTTNCLQEEGQRLKEAREAKGMSLSVAADIIGVTEDMLSRYEEGEEFAMPFIVERMADVYGVKCDYIIFGKEEWVPPPLITEEILNER